MKLTATVALAVLALVGSVAQNAKASPQLAYNINFVPPNTITYEVVGSPYRGQTLPVDGVVSNCDALVGTPAALVVDQTGHASGSVGIQCLCGQGTARINIWDPAHTTVLGWTEFTFTSCAFSSPTLGSTKNWAGDSPKPAPALSGLGRLLLGLIVVAGGAWYLVGRKRRLAVARAAE